MTDAAPMTFFTRAGFEATYPSTPGFKEHDTSRKAADTMTGSVVHLRELCLSRLGHGAFTADEVAEWAGVSVLSMRPRMTELLKLGKVRDTGLRRSNASGRSAKVWCLA